MPRVTFVKKARKDNPVCKAGESYYWWKFRYGGKHFSLTPPKRSQLTQSDFLSRMYEVEDDMIGGLSSSGMSAEDLKGEVENICDELRQLAEECEEKRYNMPEGLQEGDVGLLLEERSYSCEDMCSELEGIDLEDYDGPDVEDYTDPPEEYNEWLAAKIEELQGVSYQGG
jgi:hypothetical protein